MKMNRTQMRLILFTVFLVSGCSYFYWISFDKAAQNDRIRNRRALPTTRQAQDLDFAVLLRHLREYFSSPSKALEEQLFPWWFDRRMDRNSTDDHRTNERWRGIIICTGDEHFPLSIVALKALQSIGNELPIEVVYSTSNDLSTKNRDELKKFFPNIELVDLSLRSLNDNHLKLRGWEIKPFSVLASKFRHVLLMDADVLFLEKPVTLFENSHYLNTGSLFFYDRTSLSRETVRWIEQLHPG